MNDDRNELMGMIREVVEQQTRYYKHYVGNVFTNLDPLGKGRVLVGIPELNIVTADQGIWAYPRDKNSMSIPKMGSFVEIYFIDANRNRAVYLGLAYEMGGQTSANYDGAPTTHVLFEAPMTSESVVYNELMLSLELAVTQLKLCGGTEAFVLGTTLDIWLNALIVWLAAHVHNIILPLPATPTTPPTVLPVPVKPLITSLFISGS